MKVRHIAQITAESEDFSMVKRYSSNIVKRYSDNVVTHYRFNTVKWYRFNVVKRYALVCESARKSQVRSGVVGNSTTIVLSHIYKRAKELHQAAASSWELERRTELDAGAAHGAGSYIKPLRRAIHRKEL